MAKSWSDVAASSAFQALSFDEKEEARWQYFDSVIAPQVPEEDLGAVRSLFDTDTQLGQPLPEGVAPSQAGAGRGVVNPEPASPYTTAKSIGELSAFDRESDASAVIAGVGDALTSPSVIYGAELPEQKPLIERRGAPVSEQKFQELKGIYDRSTPDARKQLIGLGGFEGSVYQSIDDQYKEIQSSRLRGAVDTRAEMQRQDEIKPSEFDFATKEEYARPESKLVFDEVGGMPSARRVGPTGIEELDAAAKAVGGKISGQFTSSMSGAWQLIGDLASAAGASDFGQRMSAGSAEEQRAAKAKLEAIGENPNAILNFVESGVSGAVTNIAPFMLGGTTGLAAVGVQVFGDEYGSGKLAGLSPTDSFKRATAMTVAEIIGEKANMPTKLLGTFKKAMRGVPAEQIMPEFGRFLVRENLSEQVTTALQFGTDKWASFGLTPNATMDDYLKAVEDTFQQTMAQTLVTGGVGAGITGLVRKIEAAQPAEQQFAKALEQSVEQSQFLTPASELAARRMSADSQDFRMVRPDQTVRQPGDVGPAPMVNFTEPDSDSAKAGLTPIVVPVPTQQPVSPEPVSVGGAATGLTGATTAIEPADQTQTNRPFERATDQELLSRIPGYEPTPVGAGDTGEPPPVEAMGVGKFKKQWVGRKGDGYVTEADAAQALPGRQKMFPDLQWRIEQMADGKFRLAGYEFQTTGDLVGTQTNQAVQTAAQGAEAAAETAAGTEAAEVPDTALAGVSLVGDEDQVRSAVQQRLNDWAATQPGMTAPVLGKPDADAEATVNVLGNLFGEATGIGQNRVIAFSDPGGGVNGFATAGMAFVNTAEDTTVSAPRTTLHEIKHVVEQIASADTKAGRIDTPAQQFVAEVDSIFDDMTDDGKRSYVENFLHKEELDAIADPAQREQRVQELMQAPGTRSEMVADFMGNRAHDREFLLDLAAQDPGGFKSFVDKWLNVIDNLIAKLKGAPKATKQESDKVDSYVKDLTKAKMVARDALIKFRKGNLGQAAEIAAEGDVAASKASRLEMNFKDVVKRTPELQEAAAKLQSGEMTAKDYDAEAEAMAEPQYKFVVIDPRNNNKVMGKYKSRSTALRGRDRLDNAYGAYRYQVQRIDGEGPKMSLAQGEDIGAKLKARIDSDFDGAAQEYSQLDGTKGGRLLDTDIARELSPEYQQDRNRSAEVHEAASAFTQRLFEQRMDQPGTGDIVVFMAGGGGSGKSSAESLLSPVLDRASTILDGTLSSYDKARRNVQMALDSGRQVRIAYVYREPEEALRNGVLKRSMRTGRTVPVTALVKGHAGSSEVVRKLQKEFGDNPKFKIFAVDNSKSPGAAQIAPLESITPVIMDGLKERFINAAEEEYNSGRISESVYRATTGGQVDTAAGTEVEAGRREVRQGPDVDVQERAGSERATDTVTAEVTRDELVVDGVRFSSKQRNLVSVPTIELQDLVGKKVFGIKADLMDAGRSYTGIDGSQLEFPVEMMGGPGYPRLKESQQNQVVWAVRGGAVLTKILKQAEKSDYIIVHAMNGNSHLTNSTATSAYLMNVESYLRDGRISRENLLALDEIVRSPKNKSGLPDFPGFESPEIYNYIDGLSFEQRGSLAAILGKKEAQVHGLPNLDRFRRETLDPEYVGYRQGDAMLLIELDKNRTPVRLGEGGTKLHPAYPLALRGKVVGKFSKGINYETIYREYFDSVVPTFKKAEKDAWYTFDRIMPVQEITPEIAGSVSPGGFSSIKFARQAEAALAMANKDWLVSGRTKAQGGVSVQEFVDALAANDGAAALTLYTADEVKKGVKDKTFRVYQLGSKGGDKGLQIFFGLKSGRPWYADMIDGVSDNEVEVVSVTNNEPGAPGVGIPAIITKAISEGATVLDAYAVKSKRFQNGFLPEMYSQFGFEEIGRIPFDEQYVVDKTGDMTDAEHARLTKLKMADLKAFWSRGGWTEADGYPDVVVMRWKGKDEDRATAVERYVRSGDTGVSVEAPRYTRAAAGESDQLSDSPRRAKGRAGRGNAVAPRGNQGAGDAASVVTRAFGSIRELATLSDGDIRNLGLDPAEVQRLKEGLADVQFSQKPAGLARGPGARSDEGTGRTVTGIHYGKFPGLSSLNGTSFGSGIKGAEHERLSRPGVDPRIKKRVYFYLTSSDVDMPRPETGLGSHVYRATLGNMFDMSTATQEQKAKVQSLRKTSDANGFESAVLDAGFRGYVNREQGTAVVLNSNVPVAYEGLAQAGKMRDRIIQRVAPKNETRQSGDELVRRPTSEELMFIIKAKSGLAEAAPSFKLQFGEARVKQSESQAADKVLADAGSSFRFNDVPSIDKDSVAEELGRVAGMMEKFSGVQVSPTEVMLSKKMPAADRIKWREVSDVKKEIGLDKLPRHIVPFAKYMQTMADKASNGGLTSRDVIKAYTIARSSMNRSAVATDKVRASGLVLPDNFSDAKIRPEGAFGYWLLSPVGQTYLNAAEVAIVDQGAIADAVKVMAPFGTQNTLGKDLERAASGDLHTRLPAMSAAIVKASQGEDAVTDWQDATENMYGVREAKKGFLGSLLGFGQLPTFDARQINVNVAKESKEDTLRALSSKSARDVVSALARRMDALSLTMDPKYRPFYQHLTHHAVWDAVGGTETTHQDVIDSMIMASKQQPAAASLADDLERQQVFLQERAQLAGYKDIDEFVENDYPAFEQATREWREQNPAEMLLAKKQAANGVSSDEADLASIFKQLDNARGRKLKKAKADAAKHPLAGRIAMVNENFYDILEKLDDAGVIKINCK